MKIFFRNQPQLKRLLFAFFHHLCSSDNIRVDLLLKLYNPRATTEEMFSKRVQVYQHSSIAIKNVTNVHSNLDRVTQWANAGFDRGEIDLLGKEQLAVLDGVNKMIKKPHPEQSLR